jgi:hypothetical protein
MGLLRVASGSIQLEDEDWNPDANRGAVLLVERKLPWARRVASESQILEQ